MAERGKTLLIGQKENSRYWKMGRSVRQDDLTIGKKEEGEKRG